MSDEPGSPLAEFSRPLPAWLLYAASAVLALIAAAYLGRGFRFLLGDHVPTEFLPTHLPSDLYQRWDETHRAMSGDSPYRIRASPYPPSSFPSLALFVWPRESVVRWYFATINVGCLALMAGWAAAQASNRAGKILLAAATLAMASNCTALGVGQTSIIVTALVVATLCLAEVRSDYLAGLVFGIALMKPTIAGLFIIPLLFRKRISLFVVAAVYVVLSASVTLAWVHISPTAFLRNWRAMSEGGGFAQGTGGLISMFQRLGIEVKMAMTIVAVTATAATVAVCWWIRNRRLSTGFAIACLGGRLWSYHTQYDNMMLMFLLVGLGSTALRTGSRLAWAGFVMIGLSLWTPAKVNDLPAVQSLQVLLWIAAAVVLLAVTRPEVEPRRS